MGNPFSHRKMETNAPAMQGVTNLENWGGNVGLGKAGKVSKRMLAAMEGGDYSGLAGGMLAPIHDRFATNTREMVRNNAMGGNAMYAGTQPALMAGLEDETRRQMAQDEGLAYGQAIPQLFGEASNQYQGALNSQRGSQLSAMQSALQGRLGANQYITQPGWMDRIGQIAGMAGGAMGMAGLGGPGRSAGPPMTNAVNTSQYGLNLPGPYGTNPGQYGGIGGY